MDKEFENKENIKIDCIEKCNHKFFKFSGPTCCRCKRAVIKIYKYFAVFMVIVYVATILFFVFYDFYVLTV